MVEFIDESKTKVGVGVNRTREVYTTPSRFAGQMEDDCCFPFDIKVKMANCDVAAGTCSDVNHFALSINGEFLCFTTHFMKKSPSDFRLIGGPFKW